MPGDVFMLNFDFYSPARLIFGKGTESQIGELLKPHARKVLLHYGGGSIKKNGLYDIVVDSLKAGGISFVELGGVKPNPRIALVHEGIALCKKENVDLVLAVGGGSVIDSAKAIAMGVYYDGDIWDAYEIGVNIEKALPVATILTIPAAGSEASGDTVITNEAKQMKYGFGSPLLRPLLRLRRRPHQLLRPLQRLSRSGAPWFLSLMMQGIIFALWSLFWHFRGP